MAPQIKAVPQIPKVSLAFAYLPDNDLDVFSANNVICLTGNASFPELTVKPADLGVLQVNYHTALLASVTGGSQARALKNEARLPLIAAMRLNAAYVQGRPGLTLSMLLSSGYLAIDTNRSQSELDTPSLTVDNGNSTQLIAHVPPVANAHSYQVQAMTPDGKVVATVVSTQGRNIVVPGLTPGVVYTLQARAVGGSTDFSDWSDPVSHMCM
jgi:hypothetical protein